MGLTQEFQLESSSRTEFLRGLKKRSSLVF